jgi:thiol-disulfide isomerase/thioredoxin
MKRTGMLVAAMVAVGFAGSLASAEVPKSKANVKGATRMKLMRSQTDGKVAPSVSAKKVGKGPRPIIKVENDTHDFGTVWVGPKLNHTYKITNAGQAVLKITKVKPSCGCTTAGPYPKELAPGETGEFSFSMNSAKLRGNFQKNVSIESNDPVTPKIRLRLKGEVKRYVDISPSSANFGRITDQEPRTRELTITNNTDKPLKLTMKPGRSERFSYELIEKEAGKRYALRVTAKPPFKEGRMNDSALLETNVDQQKTLSVRAIGTVPPRLEVQPNSVIVNKSKSASAAGARPISRVLRFTNYGKIPAKLLSATVNDPAVTVSVRERKVGEAYTVEIQMPAGYVPPPEGRMITLKLDDKEKPEIQVPIRTTATPRAAAAARPKAASLLGTPAPQFSLKTIEDKPLSNATVNGNVTVLNFFAPNCGYCKKQIPRLEKVRAEFASKGVRFVNVSQKMGSKEYSKDDVVNIIKSLGFRGELALNHNNSVGRSFGASGFPTMIVLDKKGKIAAKNVGNIGDLETRLKGQLTALIAGKSVPTQFAAKPKPKAPSKGGRVDANSLVGKPAPSFSLKTTDGKDVSNGSLRSSPATVLNFFAVNCGFCKKQIPRLEKVRKDFASKGVRFINVQETMRKEYSQDEALAKMKDLGWAGEFARDPKNILGPKFGATGFPTMVVLGKTGKIEAVNRGNIADLEKRLAGQLTAIVAGKPVPSQFAQKPPARKKSPNQQGGVVGKMAPKFNVDTVGGKQVSNQTFGTAKATVMNFFAINCGYCKKQIPRLETVRKDYEKKGVRFVNVQETMRKEYTTEEGVAKMKDLGWGGELARDPKNALGPKFGARGFPTMAVIDAKGKIQAVNVGNIGDLETKLKSQLDMILAGKDVPMTASSKPKTRRRPALDTIGKKAPSFAIKTLDGTNVGSADFDKYQATVLNFVAPNCGYCKRQVPNVEKVRAAYESKGVRFVNVVQKMRKDFTDAETKDIFAKAGSNLALARDAGNKVGKDYKATSFPTMVVVDKAGMIKHVTIGAKANMESLLSGQLDAMIKGN